MSVGESDQDQIASTDDGACDIKNTSSNGVNAFDVGEKPNS